MNFNTVDGTVEWFHSSRALLEQAVRARPSSRRRHRWQRRRAAWLAAAVVVSVAGPWLVRGQRWRQRRVAVV